MPKKTRTKDYSEVVDEIAIDSPMDRDGAEPDTQAVWPEGWWAVSDGNDGYIAFFAHEEDACAFKQLLVLSICDGGDIAKRYRRTLPMPEQEKQYGVFDTWKGRWHPFKPMSQVDAACKATALNSRPNGAGRFQSKQLHP
jgi:hypothetical protein